MKMTYKTLNDEDQVLLDTVVSRYAKVGVDGLGQIIVAREREIERYRKLIEDLRNKITEREFKIKQLEIKINNTGELLQEKVEKSVLVGKDDTVVIIKGPGKVESVDIYFQEDEKCHGS